MKVVTFGEIMLRLAPEGYLRFTQADKFGVVYGELVSLSKAEVALGSKTKHDLTKCYNFHFENSFRIFIIFLIYSHTYIL